MIEITAGIGLVLFVLGFLVGTYFSKSMDTASQSYKEGYAAGRRSVLEQLKKDKI